MACNSDGDVLREVAEACKVTEWSRAIKLLSSLKDLPVSSLLLCNRAWCYSKLELHKHVIKDSDKALALNPHTLQAYLYKGEALAALGKRQEACQVWQQGYEAALGLPMELPIMVQLHCLFMQMGKGSLDTGHLDSGDVVTSNADGGNVTLPLGSRPVKPLQQEVPAAKKTSTAVVTNPRRKNKVSGTTGQVSDSEVIEKIDGGPRNSQPSRGLHSLTVDIRLSKGIGQVNRGNYEEAVRIFDMLLRENPRSSSALLGRGTAYAFLRKLDVAVSDFSQAIAADPTAGEAWKRRGQARAALGASLEAVGDLSKALELEPRSPDLLHERGVVYYKLKDFKAAIDDLRRCLASDANNKYAYNYLALIANFEDWHAIDHAISFIHTLGLALTSAGDYVEGIQAQRKAVQLDVNFKEGWTHLAQSYKELADSDKALECLRKALALDDKYVQAHRLWGILLHGLGDHKNSAKRLTASLELDLDNLECLYLRASCYHALGQFTEAVRDYDVVVNMDIDSTENHTLQYLAFYQRENALYTASKLTVPFSRFDIDGDLDPLFKEAWCKRLRPIGFLSTYKLQPVLKDLPKGGRLRQQDTALTRTKKSLLEAADQIGRHIQYDSPGFLTNARQHRMAGLAALEIAQKVSYTWRAIRDSWDLHGGREGLSKSGRKSKRKGGNGGSASRGGQCSSKSGHSANCRCHEDDDGLKGPIVSTWRDVYSIAVKWRQVSEPCDSVVWVDMLSEKEYTAGFGSHTPMILGQAHVVRYYPNFPRAFKTAKDLILERRRVNDAANRIVDLSDPTKLKAVDAARNCSDLYKLVGRDFWVVTPCNSTAKQGKVLDGTRLTMQKMGANGFDFSIRTPGTPARWTDYDAEMAAAWQALCDVYCNEESGSPDADELEHVRDCILRLSFYWYNFMPLARGTAVVGFVTLLGLFLAANMMVSTPIPKSLQVDWEAILAPDLESFMGAIRPWLYPALKMDTSWQSLPDVAATFGTTGAVIAALSSYECSS